MPQDGSLRLTVTSTFEACLEVAWEYVPSSSSKGRAAATPIADSVVEMVIIHPVKDLDITEPPDGAMRKKVQCGTDETASIGNMPTGREFLISVVGTLPGGGSLRSPWVRTATLDASDLASTDTVMRLDLFGRMRLECTRCGCKGYVQDAYQLGSPASKARCRRCGCHCNDHKKGLMEAEMAAMKQLAADYCRDHKRETCVDLPTDAVNWSSRDCSLWFASEGRFHPRRDTGLRQKPPPKGNASECKRGVVSVITPTSETRQNYHELLWKNFDAQEWPVKELIVIETYGVGGPSPFFTERYKSDSRVIYVGIDRTKEEDLTIGLKRNIGVHLARGEYIAHFDDDDLYAPNYLSIMVGKMKGCLAATLSSWFILDVVKHTFGYCDPIKSGLQRGKPPLKEHLYGYGFSYVYRREVSLELPFDNRSMGEDFDFFARMMNAKGLACVALHEDVTGICLHTQHHHNTSKSFKLRDVAREEVGDLDVARSAGFDKYMEVSGMHSGIVQLMEHFVPWFAEHPGTAALIANDLVRGFGPV